MKSALVTFVSRYWFVVGSLCLTLSSYCAGTVLSVLLGWAASLSLAYGWRYGAKPIMEFWLGGVIFYLSAFYWLPNTLSSFGGFPLIVSGAMFVCFAMFSGLQFLFSALLSSWLDRLFGMERSVVSFALAWMICEVLFPSMFPWRLAHPQLAFTYFAINADLLGVYPLSFLMLYFSGALVGWGVTGGKPRLTQLFFAASLMCVALIRGWFVSSCVLDEMTTGEPLKFAMIQGNISATDKRDVGRSDINIRRYLSLSKEALGKGAAVLIWPESAVTSWIPEAVGDIGGTFLDFSRAQGLPSETVVVTGALSYAKREEVAYRSLVSALDPVVDRDLVEQLRYRYYNAVVAIGNGKIEGRYYKKVLMPFGEYLPFSDRYPKVRKLSPYSGDFSSGKRSSVIELSGVGSASGSLKLGALICYEDLIPELSLDASQDGAQVLINFTNDAWYGQTYAPSQHNLLAAWRAIETERFLLRATNTGLSSIVDPLGRIVEQLPIFKEGIIVRDIIPLNRETFYVRVGDVPIRVCCWAVLAFAVLGRMFRSSKRMSASLSKISTDRF